LTNRIYCLACRKFYRKETTGVTVTLEKEGPRLVRGDVYRCPDCGHEVYGDFGDPFDAVRPKFEKYTPQQKAHVEALRS
jgi:hypothetical protein